MAKNRTSPASKKPDPERKRAFESLPPTIKESLTEEEVQLFLYAEEWPDSLFAKMDEFIIKNQKRDDQ